MTLTAMRPVLGLSNGREVSRLRGKRSVGIRLTESITLFIAVSDLIYAKNRLDFRA